MRKLFCSLFLSHTHSNLKLAIYEICSLFLQLTSLLSEIGLNIQEAHAFSTVDGYSLDVFVVDGWPYEVVSFSFLFSCHQSIKPVDVLVLENRLFISFLMQAILRLPILLQ